MSTLGGGTSHKSSWGPTGSLLAYSFAGIPFCLLFSKWGKDGVGTKSKLGEMSAAERAAQGGGPPGSQMGGPPMSGVPSWGAMPPGSLAPPGSAYGGAPPGSGYGGGPPMSGGYGGYPQQGMVRY